MKFLDDLTTKPKIFQHTVGLSLEQFNLLANKLEANSFNRKTTPGRHSKARLMKHRLLVTLLYYKTYLTQELIGVLVKINQSNISRLLTKMSNLIEKAADPDLKSYLQEAKQAYEQISPEKYVKSIDDFFKKHADLKEVATDSTEQACYRSTNYDKQKKHFSGKKKRHTVKTQLAVSSTGRILDVSDTYPGSVHDKNVIDQEQTVKKMPKDTRQLFDSGYQGVESQNPGYTIVVPHKKPKNGELLKEKQEFNRLNSKQRIIVENVISRIKKFKICQFLYRGPMEKYNQTFRNISALVNFRLANNMI